MKKTIILIGILLAFMLATTSCGDSFLNVKPTVDIPAEEFFTSEEKLMSSLTAAYQPLMWPDWAFGQYSPLQILGDIMGDDVLPGGENQFDNEHWHRMRNFNATSDFTPSALWLVAYSGVNRANIVINNIDNVAGGVSDKAKNRALAEALTLRAYYYNILWKFWGNIPHYNVNPSSMPFLVDQMPADEVYEKIIADLDLALADGKLDKTVNIKDLGRITHATAQMLKASVVMYQNDESKYAEVLTDMKDIINTGKYSLYANFGEIWEDEGEWSSESVFEVNYTDNPSGRSWNNPLGQEEV